MLFYVLFSIDSRGLDHGNFLQQLRKYEFVTPQLHAHGRWKRDTSTQTNSVSDEPIPYSDIHSVCAISQLFPLTVVYFASMNRIFFCGHIACICKNWFVNWRHHAVFNEKQYVKLTLRLGWSFGKNTFVLKGIWQRLHLGRRPKPVSRALKLPHSFEQSFGETAIPPDCTTLSSYSIIPVSPEFCSLALICQGISMKMETKLLKKTR